MGILRLPGQVYDHLHASFGWFGVAFAGVAVVVGIVGILIWFDRRR
jgi:hypothetical protein